MSRLYIRVMTGFYTHRKTVKLRSKIGTDANWVVPRLWAYAAENQPDGDLSGYTSEEIAEVIGCHKHAPSMLQALKDCGFVDENGMIHDWAEHNRYHKMFSIRAKIAAEARWAKTPPTPPKDTGNGTVDSGQGSKHDPSIGQACSKHAPVEEREANSRFAPPTLESVKLQASKIGMPDVETEKFFNYYTSNGWRIGRNAMRSWPHALSNWKLNAKNYGHPKANEKANPRNNGVITDPQKQSVAVAEVIRRRSAARDLPSLGAPTMPD